MAPLYTLWVTDPVGNRLGLLSDPLSIDITRSVNNVGALSVVLRGDYPSTYLAEDNRIEVWRSLDGRPPSLVTNTSWFLRRFEKRTSKGQRTYTLGAVSALELTKRRIVAYNSDDTQSNKNGPADDVLKSIVRENLSYLSADSSRSWDGLLSIAGNLSQGPNTVQSISRKEVFGVLQDVSQAAAAAGTPVFFDITGYGTNLMFQTWVGIRGIDHTFPYSNVPVVLSPQMGNLDDCSVAHDYSDEVTAVYAAGSGTTGSRHVIGVTDPKSYDASPFNPREKFITNTQATSAFSTYR